MFGVQQHDAEVFGHARAERGHQIRGSVLGRLNLKPGFRRVCQCPAPHLERRDAAASRADDRLAKPVSSYYSQSKPVRGRILTRMPASARFLLPCVLILSLFAMACGDDPPENEMQQAQGAIDAAGAAGAAE